jgi:hypothetical protein
MRITSLQYGKMNEMKKNLLLMVVIVLLTYSLLDLNMIGITVAQPDHDVAVIGVTPFPTSVRLGEPVDITVVVENQGAMNETNFNVTVYYDAAVIETKTVQDLAAGAGKNLTFTWNTTGVTEEVYNTTFKQKTYFIDATASTVPGETDTEDNTLRSNSTVKIISQYIAVVPESIVDTTLTPDKNFTVSIYTDYNGTDIWGWQFSLTYNPNVLEGVSVTNGDLITEAKHDSAEFTLGTFDNTLGRSSLTVAYFFYMPPDEPYVTSGPGILANITFTVVGTGDSDITLVESETQLKGYKDGQIYEIVSNRKPDIGHILHGYFRNAVEAVTHDVAILSVTPSNTTVTEGDLVNITVVVENQGTVPETVTVAAYYDKISPNYLIATTKTVQSLEADANASLTFVWNTTDISILGTYSIWAEAGTVLGETDTEDNRREGEDTVTVKGLPRQRVPIELAIGIVVVVVLAGAVVLYAVRRRRKPTPE